MPKRKHSEDEDSDRIRRKIRRMEKKLKKHRRRLRCSNSSSSDDSVSCNITVPLTAEDVEDLLPVHELPDGIEDVEATCTSTPQSPPDQISTIEHMTDPAAALTATPVAPTAISVVPGSFNNADKPPDDEIILDEEILVFLGEAPNKDKKFGPKIQNDIASRWEHVATSGISKDVRKEFLEKYLTPENCSLIDPPALNLEVKAALSEALQKKDAAIQSKQKQISSAVSCIGQALKRALSQDSRDSEMIKLLIDAGRIVCDVQHTESTLRRGFIGSFIKKDVKDHLNETRIDKFLFGEKLSDTLRAAKSIHKSGTEIRAPNATPRTMPRNKHAAQPLNLKGPATTNRPLPAGRRLEDTAPAPPPRAPQRRRPLPPPPPPPRRSQQQQRAPRR